MSEAKIISDGAGVPLLDIDGRAFLCGAEDIHWRWSATPRNCGGVIEVAIRPVRNHSDVDFPAFDLKALRLALQCAAESIYVEEGKP